MNTFRFNLALRLLLAWLIPTASTSLVSPDPAMALAQASSTVSLNGHAVDPG
jgi:hypothetical protein